MPADFFFLRPLWLVLLIPAAFIVYLTVRGGRRSSDSAWRNLVDPHLLVALTVQSDRDSQSRLKPVLLGVALAAAIIAMAGPTWERIELPSFKTKAPTVVVLSLAQSMNADDVKPSRLTRAGHKLRDVLDAMDGGDTGLVIYSDEPFVAAPLTSDGEVIRQMLPELSTNLMPTLGNRLDLAIEAGAALLDRAGAASGQIVILADSSGSEVDAAVAAAQAAETEGYTIDVIGIGTDQPVALRTASGRQITARDGEELLAGFDEDGLRRVAEAGGGLYAPLSAGRADVDRVLADALIDLSKPAELSEDFKADGWADMGYWLLIIPVLLAPLAFRRNVMMGVILIAGSSAMLPTDEATAAGWEDLWRTPDQQAAIAFDDQDFGNAAERFENQNWRGAALYRSGEYEKAAEALAGAADPDALFNRGNALAKAGDLEGALEAYDEILQANPDDADARFNRDLVARLLEERKQQEQQEQEQQQAGQPDQSQQREGEQNQDQAGNPQAGESGDEQPQDGTEGEPSDGEQQQAQNNDEEQSDQGNQNAEPEDAAEGPGEADQGEDEPESAATDGEEPSDEEPQAEPTDVTGDEPSAFESAMDDALGEATIEEIEPDPAEEAAAIAATISEEQQAAEQLLRRVPDDPTGLLRARIRQHYARQR